MKKHIKKMISYICLLAIILTSLISAPVAKAKDADGEMIMVSLGDSYSSGEGIPDFYGQEADVRDKVYDQDWLGHRSQKSWSGRLTLPGIDKTMKDHRDENWYFVASSGAKTCDLKGRQKQTYNKIVGYDVWGTPQYITNEGDDEGNMDPQLDVFDKLNSEGKQADFVTLTMGGNDAEFSNVVMDAICNYFSPNQLNDKLNEIWKKFYKEEGIFDSLKQAYKDIEEAAGKEAFIIVAGYPKLLNKDGKGVLFNKETATIVNDSVVHFNDEIERLVGICRSEGMNIQFVSVEEKFDGREAYSSNSFLNNIVLKVGGYATTEDLKDSEWYSAYSMHPNDKGAQVYADCVQEAIKNYLDLQEAQKEQEEQQASTEREVVLVLDNSGSMDTKLDETKQAANKFVETVLDNNVRSGLVTYSSDSQIVSAFSSDEADPKEKIQSIGTGGSTNIEAGLKTADSMLRTSAAKKKIIVLMSDGAANEGRVSDDLVKYANHIKKNGTIIYTLGFFDDLGEEKSEEQRVMEAMASPGCHYEVDDANSLVFFFGDIADQISGEKFIYIRIACPVDVEVEYKNEKLSSKSERAMRTDFGSITFEENSGEKSSGSDNRVKILRLRDGEDYNVKITGNGSGTMDYSIMLTDENGEYVDSRVFSDVEINNKTVIDTVANDADKTVLKVDNDGDGKYDLIYKAKANSIGEIVDNSRLVRLIIFGVALVVFLILFVIIRKKTLDKRKALVVKYADYIDKNNLRK